MFLQQYITFDDPHLPAGTVLKGQYPTGVIDWGADQWRINVPEGGFGTFNLALVDLKAYHAELRFCWPRDVCGPGCLQRGNIRRNGDDPFGGDYPRSRVRLKRGSCSACERDGGMPVRALPSSLKMEKASGSTTWRMYRSEVLGP